MENIFQFTLKYRPKSFNDIYGQPGPIREFLNKLKTGKLSQAYLIKGLYGTGKTTFAQLVAMSINCSNLKENLDPCCECSSCKSIINESFDRDTVMLDGSTIGQKDEVIDFTSMADSMPMFDKNKIFIIEETDQLSSAAKNALHKILEKPRKNVFFILLSMNNSGVPPSIQSRCQTYKFNPISIKDTMYALKNILEKEGLWNDKKIPKEFKLQGLQTIATVSKGSLRDSVQILERCVSGRYFSTQEMYDNIGLVDEATIANILIKALEGENVFHLLEPYQPLEIFQLGYTILVNAFMYKHTGYIKTEYFESIIKKILSYDKNFPLLLQAFRNISEKAKSYLRSSEVNDELAIYYSQCNNLENDIKLMDLVMKNDVKPLEIDNLPMRKRKTM